MTAVIASAPADPGLTGVRGAAAELHAVRAKAPRGVGGKAAGARHARGGPAARERVRQQPDAGPSAEAERPRRRRATGFGPEARRPCADGVITGWGTAGGRTVFVCAHDFRVFGGAPAEARAAEIHKIMDMAIAAGAPPVSLDDGAGARVREGAFALADCGGVVRRDTGAFGVIPRIPVMPGPRAGGAACPAAGRGLADDVTGPAGTRGILVRPLALAMPRTGHADLPSREHGNPPQ